MLLDFDEHHRHRRIMQQAFTSERLAGYLEPMNATLADGLANWPTQRNFQVYPALKQLTLDIATRTFMGLELGPEADRLNRAFADCVRAGTAVIRFPVPGADGGPGGWSGGRCSSGSSTRACAAKRASDDGDLFSALCHARSEEDGARFSDEDIVNHMIFLLMAAHDTTTITMTTMAYYLAKHPDWQERCRAESLAVGTPTARLRPPRPARHRSIWSCASACGWSPLCPAWLARRSRTPRSSASACPADTFVSVNMQGTHHLAEYWPDPERFDPERFAEHRREDKVHRHAWIPFGSGVHKCIGLHFGGMQVKAAMHQLLLGHRWKRRRATYEMPIDWTSLPRPKDGLPDPPHQALSRDLWHGFGCVP